MTVVVDGAAVLSGASHYALATPYAAADLPQLSYAQNGNVIKLVHPLYPPQDLTRVANNNWTLAPTVFGANVQPPTALQAFVGGTTIDEDLEGWDYVVTAVGSDGEESLQSIVNLVIPTDSAHKQHPLNISWAAPTTGPAPLSYRIYRRPPADTSRYSGAQSAMGAYGLIGVSSTLQFADYGRDPDFAQQPPVGRTVFAAAGDYPSLVGYWQQRAVYANTLNNPNKTWLSQTGRFGNFNVSVPVKDDDAISFTLNSATVDAIRHMVASGQLTLLTEGGEWTVFGDQNGVLTPSTCNPRKTSAHGVGLVRPVLSGNNLIFPQALGTVVLELVGTAAAQYTGATARDLTLFSTHLFDGHQIIDMAWQQESPHVAWFVRDDGILLGMTYIPDQDVLAWHRHDTQGFIESVCVIPEVIGSRIEHRVYCVVGRINASGSATHTIERFASPFSDAIDEEAWFVDGGVEYDGRATLLATNTLSGLDHLEGLDVAVYAYGKIVSGTPDDVGYIVANPLRTDLTAIAVTGGVITLPDSYLRIVAGLPFIADLETLDIDAPEGPTAKTQKTNIGRVGAQVLDSRNVWAYGGDLPADSTPTAGMDTLSLATDADYDTLVTDFVEINTQAQWQTNGRVALRSIDPTPLTVLSLVPEGAFPSAQEN